MLTYFGLFLIVFDMLSTLHVWNIQKYSGVQFECQESFFRIINEVMVKSTDYGRPINPFFIEIYNIWAWADKLGRLILGHLRYFGPNHGAPILVQWVCWFLGKDLSNFENSTTRITILVGSQFWSRTKYFW